MLAQVLEFGLVDRAGLPEQGFGLLQHLAQPFGAGVVAVQAAVLFVDVLFELPEPLVQPPAFGILGWAEMIPGHRRLAGGVPNRRVEFGAGFGLVAQPFQQGFQRGNQLQPLAATARAGLALGQKAGARLGIAFPQFGRRGGLPIAPFLFQPGKPAGVAAALPVPAQVLHFDAQLLAMDGARLFGDQGIQAFPRPPVQTLVVVAAVAGDLVEQFGIVDPLQRGQPHVRVGISLGDVGQCRFGVDPLQQASRSSGSAA